ncbi:phosphonate C-P lyase system protein PhnH [Pseudogemmobacter faecipullorum]|uniref:Phosphonate C-P lyase system protein PhnH n=1 Tax=Pseudogemmobacter faecipullorum TaxID=2755041 RepID=A0ABS8CS37_9RHOB|nr:phosphonate C-P lyase system protein PhnH [Pseudogemmobacter faecipullorum]MCB5412218.1 phosphonate C-P lyase system protein PhnH [Pseudogemmobacter faecipullorum]
MTAVLTGGFDSPAPQSARAFRSVLEAMARPGRIETLQGAVPPAPLSVAAGTLILTLCDPTTPVYLAGKFDSAAIRSWISFHTGAPLTRAGEASFAIGSWQELQPLSAYQIGDPSYPDRSATLIVELEELRGEGARLSGPGIETSSHLSLPETRAFRENAQLFPLGIDCLFTCADRLAALPRTTRVEDN